MLFETQTLSPEPDVVAPDGADVRILPALAGGSMAHFELPAGKTSRAVSHRTVEEIWYVLTGSGQMWRRHGDDEQTVDLAPGTAITIPLGTHFQFRAGSGEALTAVAITMPAWPGGDEAFEVSGPWEVTV